MHLPDLVSDLAVILLTGGVITVIFKKLNLPLVLGYILAGFLIGPYMPLFFSLADIEAVSTWSEIGIIILMFCLGLEFNLHKLASVGGTAIITALVEVGGMLAMGFAVGQLMGWGTMDSIFLGGMLSMSSTTIIIKAFDELNVRKTDFAQLVFGTLVMEDIAGIFMMIILSTISVSKSISGGALALQLGLLVLYLVLGIILEYVLKIEMGFYQIPIVVAFLVALLVACLQNRGVSFDEKLELMGQGIGDKNIVTMILIFLVAGIFVGVTGRSSAEAVAYFLLSIAPVKLAVAVLFVVACFVSMAMGTSVGTITLLAPIAVAVSANSGFDLPLCIASVMGGAMFGDNLSFISDTTIAACNTKICLPCLTRSVYRTAHHSNLD